MSVETQDDVLRRPPRVDFVALDLRAVFLLLFFAVDFLALLFLADDFFALARLLDDFFPGTLAPARLASESPIAIACFGFVTFLPERPLFNVPRFCSRIASPTFC